MQYSSTNKLKLLEKSDKVNAIRQNLVDNLNIIDNGLNKFYVSSLTSANTYKITTGNSLTTIPNGFGVRVAIPSDSDGAVSIMVDSVTVPVKLSDGSDVTDFKANGVYYLTYNNGNFICASGGKNVDSVNFTSDMLLTGYTANDSNGKAVNGSMPDNGSPMTTLNCGGSYNLQAGYYGGGIITANSLASQTADANAGTLQIVPPYTAYVNGQKVTGTMNVMQPTTTTQDGVHSQFDATGIAYGVYSKDDTNPYVYFGIPQWSYTSKNEWIRYKASTLAYNIGLTADKIVSGNTICGITGTGGGGYVKTDTITVNSSNTIQINLGFTPKLIFITHLDSNDYYSINYVYNKSIRNMSCLKFYKKYTNSSTTSGVELYTSELIVNGTMFTLTVSNITSTKQITYFAMG